MALPTVAAQNYAAFLAKKEIALIMFYATWEAYHKNVEIHLEKLVPQWTDKVNMGKVDLDDPAFEEVVKSLGISNCPILVVYKRSRPLLSSMGNHAPPDSEAAAAYVTLVDNLLRIVKTSYFYGPQE